MAGGKVVMRRGRRSGNEERDSRALGNCNGSC